MNNKNKPLSNETLKYKSRLNKIIKNKTISNENRFTPDNMIERYEKPYKIYKDVLALAARQRQAKLNNNQRKTQIPAKIIARKLPLPSPSYAQITATNPAKSANAAKSINKAFKNRENRKKGGQLRYNHTIKK